MIQVESDHNICFDVDDTLIIHSFPKSKKKQALTFIHRGQKLVAVPHKAHIELLKEYHKKHYRVFVWSMRGYDHAKNVIEKLGLQDYVFQVMTKPMLIVDDLPPQQFLKRIYAEPFCSDIKLKTD